MSFEHGPTIRIDDLDETTARAIFGNAFYDAWKWAKKTGRPVTGVWLVSEADRKSGVITVTADE